MIHNLKINIKFDIKNISNEEYLQIISEVSESMSEDKKIRFIDLDNLFLLEERNYVSTSIDYANLDRDETIPAITTIEIKG